MRCDTCIQDRPERHLPYGKLQSPQTPTQAWKSIALDFIVKLPLSEEPLTKVEYDSIMVVTDRLTKFAYFIPFMETSTAEELAYLYYRHVWCHHGMPDEMISDRDKLFTSHFWKSLLDLLGTKQKMSTAFHPQTDGQTEWINSTLEQYLWHYVDYRQTNWVTLLPVAQFAWNHNAGETLKTSPFYANYGFEPKPYGQPWEISAMAEYACVEVEQIKGLQETLALDIKFFAERAAVYANEKCIGSPKLKEGDKVYLLWRNVKTKRPSSKLDHKKLGAFLIKRQLGPVNFELKLPSSMKIHPVFHISLLEPAPPNAKTIILDLSEEN